MIKILTCRRLKCLALASISVVLVDLFWKAPSASKRPTPLRKELYEVISPSTYKHVLNQPELCKVREPFLLLLIPVTQEDSGSRAAIRNTWGQENVVPHVNITRLFFMGEPPDPDAILQRELREESRTHGDIIQMDFLDTYHNLTVKTMMMMNWIATYCTSARYAMKIDADIFLNVPFLVDYLHRQANKQNYITGSVITDGRPRRDIHSKWYLSEELYPENKFKPYVSGAGYVFSTDLAKKISMASRFVRPIPLEDVYVGLCLDFLGIRPVFSWTLLPFTNLFEIRRLEYDRCTFAKRIIVTGFTPHHLLDIWHDFQGRGLSC